MAVTGAVFKALSFDGESSRNYGVYISGEAVYNAPAREVEMISIPGRNGQLALDKGRFENIEVTYHGGIFGATEQDFAAAVSDFRNMLVSKKGYCRLTDDYNNAEYRLAVYKSGLEVTPAMLKAGEFDIVFNCMPQRFLADGENPIEVSSGDVVTNPTLFESKPLLEAEGYGVINIGGTPIEIKDVPLGETIISKAADGYDSLSVTLDTTKLIVGDSIYSNVSGSPRVDVRFKIDTNKTYSASAGTNINCSTALVKNTKSIYTLSVVPDLSFVKGTSSTIASTAQVLVTVGATSGFLTVTVTTAYDAENETITMSVTWSAAIITEISVSGADAIHITFPAFVGDSSLPIPQLMNIDLDLGEAYGEVDGEVMSFNHAVQLPANLPTLGAGDTTITFDNTITALSIVPRWWIV